MNKNVDLNSFFSKENSNIHIFLSTYRINSQFSDDVQRMLLDYFHNGWWLFQSDSIIHTFTSDCKFFIKNKKINLTTFSDIIKNTKKRWNKEYPDLLFPDIIINSGGSALSFGKDKNLGNVVYINYKTLFDVDNFKSHLGHELGHIIYQENIKDDTIVFNHNNLITKYMMIVLLSIPLVSFLEKENNLLFISTQLSLIFMAGFYYFLNLISFRNRIKRYNCEYFCDYFSYKFMKIKYQKVPFVFYIGEDFNSHTHPKSSFRRSRIEKMKNSSKFKPLNPSEMRYHQFLPLQNLLTEQQNILLYKFFILTSYTIIIMSLMLITIIISSYFLKVFFTAMGLM